MTNQDALINDVSDTSLWVAYYRAVESDREDALFKDPYAKALAGERGKKIAESMGDTARYTKWTLTIRTVIIDRLISNFVSEGFDLVLNLGAGLDTRPHRMKLPPDLLWIEVDHPHIIEHKEKFLRSEKTSCKLERVKLDLSQRDKRQEFFARVNSRGKKILVLTEGVLPYLTPHSVGELADDLLAQNNFKMWIAEYFAKQVYKYINNPKRMKQMANSPFLFFPDDWFGFFKTHGWLEQQTTYMGEEAVRLNRKIPAPWWASLLKPFASKAMEQQFLRMTGYTVFRSAKS